MTHDRPAATVRRYVQHLDAGERQDLLAYLCEHNPAEVAAALNVLEQHGVIRGPFGGEPRC